MLGFVIIILILFLIAFSVVLGGALDDDFPKNPETPDDFEKWLMVEYKRYLTLQELINLESSGEYKFALLWSIDYTIHHNTDKLDIMIHPYTPGHAAYTKLNELKYMTLENRDRLISKIIDISRKFIDNRYIYTSPGSVTIIDDSQMVILKYEKFEVSLNKIVVNWWRRETKKYSQSISDMIILILAMRYYTTLNKTSSIPLNIYTYLFKIGFNCESANPLNAVLCMTNPGARHIAWFYDVDRFIGGIRSSEILDSKQITGLVFRQYTSIISFKIIDKVNEISKKIPVITFNLSDRDTKLENPNVTRKSLPANLTIFENIYIGPHPRAFRFGSMNISIYKPPGSPVNSEAILTEIEKVYQFVSDVYDNSSKLYYSKFNKEVTRCKYVNLLKIVIKDLPPPGLDEWYKMLKQTLTAMVVYQYKNPGKDEVFVNLPPEHKIWTDLANNLKEKKITNIPPEEIVKHCASLIKQYLLLEESDMLSAKFTSSLGKTSIITPEFTIERYIEHSRLTSLADGYYNSGYFATGYTPQIDLIIAALIARYYCILYQEQQYNYSQEFYKFLYEKYNLNLECVTSPLNSQVVVMVGTVPIYKREKLYRDLFYCSIFPDIDDFFGSSGNVFKFDMLRYIQSRGFKRFVAAFNPLEDKSILTQVDKLIKHWFEILTVKKIALLIFVGVLGEHEEFHKQFKNENQWIKTTKKLNGDEVYFKSINNSDLGKTYLKTEFTFYILNNFYEVKENDPGGYDEVIKMLNYSKY